MREQQARFLPLAAKTVVCHTITYFLMGVLAAHFLHYEQMFNQPNSGLRPFNSPWIMLGAPLQIFRGILFASVFYLFREQLFGRSGGWLRMAWMLIGIGILGTFAAPGGSDSSSPPRPFRHKCVAISKSSRRPLCSPRSSAIGSSGPGNG